jgi:ribonucleoside-diphosphate reductase alpha chain
MKKLKDIIQRYYTKELEHNKALTVFDLFKWKSVDVKLVNHETGDIIFDKKNLEFPEFYSQNACDIIASKYFRLAGVNNEVGYERSLKEVAHRMVSFWVESLFDEGLISKTQKQIVYDELVYMLVNQMWSPNSPQWFNTGLKLAYGINKEAEGHYYYDTKLKKVVKAKDAYTRTQGSACFIISIEDSLLGKNSISEQVVTETRLFKQGSGTGSNYSSIRAKGEKLSGGGQSSGLMSFLKTLDANAGAIKSGGTTRRAAKIDILDADHPEIFDFVNWKYKEEQKVRALGKMGYDTDFNGEAYQTVSGQNSNNSVRVTNTLMKKMIGIDKNFEWELKGRVDNRVNKVVDARDLWNDINVASHGCADPALQFHDTSNEWHTCPAGEDGLAWEKHNQIIASNPCSEYFFLIDTSCNLASINIVRFYDYVRRIFDINGLKHAIALIQLVLEATIHHGQFPTEDIARRTHMFRATGLGIANTGTLHMLMGHPYDSDEARTIAASLMSLVTGYSYFTSSLMAQEIGPFEKFNINKKYMLEVIRNHARVSGARKDAYERLSYKPVELDHAILSELGYEDISNEIKNVWTDAVSYGEAFGYRNAQVTVLAPTGTISFAMDCGTTSIEPNFGLVVFKKLAGGGYMKMVNPAIEITLNLLGYEEVQIKEIMEYILEHGIVEGAPYVKEQHYAIFDTANKANGGTRFISPMGHVKMLAALTPMVSGSISKTVNLPSDATVDDFKMINIEAWRLGIKSIALYRDGSKASQPLNSITKDKEKSIEDMTYAELMEYAKSLKSELDKKNSGEVVNDIIPETFIHDGVEMHEVTCSNCGSKSLVPSGTCAICLQCGTTTGCS